MKSGFALFALIYGELSAIVATLIAGHLWLLGPRGGACCLRWVGTLPRCYLVLGGVAVLLATGGVIVITRFVRNNNNQ